MPRASFDKTNPMMREAIPFCQKESGARVVTTSCYHGSSPLSDGTLFARVVFIFVAKFHTRPAPNANQMEGK
jgi:hypothetical protein